MKKKDLIQIKGFDLKELKVKARDLRKEIANLSLDKNMKKLKDLKMISKKKKELAQVLTVARQKKLLGELESRVQSPAEGEARQGQQESSKEKLKEKASDSKKTKITKTRKEKTSH